VKNKEKHTIHKLSLDIHFEDFEISQKWISATQAETAEALRRTIERCLGGFEISQDYVTITKLEFDLGVFRIEELLLVMPEMLYRELKKVLTSSQRHKDHSEDGVPIGTAPSHPFSVPQVPEQKTNSITTNTEIDAFLFFLQQGHLPWWYAEAPTWNPEWLQALTKENWNELQNFLSYSDNEDFHSPAVVRLVYQFSDAFLTKLLKRLQLQEPVGKAWDWILRWHASLQTAGMADLPNKGPLPSISVIRRHFWVKWIRYTLGKSARPALAAHLAFFNQPSSITSILLGKEENKMWLDRVPSYWQHELVSLIQQGYQYRNEIKANSDINTPKFQIPENGIHDDTLSHTDKEDFILIPDSGLVLLHPFLSQLFESCNWIVKNKFLNEKAQTRAINALHYLATGDEEAPEFVLILPKILCGFPLGRPLEPTFPLTESEKDDCEEMLKQVVGHWKSLKKTSPTGLRHTFLRRQGKLYMTNEGWRLDVQRRTEDILLNRLPWGFSLVKYSWMHRMLSVSWE